MRRASTASTCCRCAARAPRPSSSPSTTCRRRPNTSAREVLAAREAGVPLQAPGGAVPQRQRTATCSKSSSPSARFPFVKYGGLKFLEAAHVKDLLAVLRWADNPRNHDRGIPRAAAACRAWARRMRKQGARPLRWRSGHRVGRPRRVRAAATTRASTWKQARRDCCDAWPTRTRAVARAGAIWRASGTSRTWSACTSTSTRASATSTSSSCCRRSTDARALHHRADARSAECHQRPVGQPSHDEDYLVLSTIHSAKGMEWDTRVHPQRRRRQLPVRIRHRQGRADRGGAPAALRGDDSCAQRSAPAWCRCDSSSPASRRRSDGHVYGGRSRFLTEKVIKCFDEQTFQGSNTEVKIERSERRLGHHRRGVAPQADVVGVD